MVQELHDAIPLAEACKLLPGSPDRATVRRWMLVGVRGVHLRGFAMGRRLYTTARDIEQFIRLASDAAGIPPRKSA